ncbi:MAG: histidine phosphatase family protein [archaeon]
MQHSIIVFRHGSTFDDENIFCGWLNNPLDKKGQAQAEVLAKNLKDENIDFAFCSDQLRSKQVLAEVLANRSKVEVFVDPRLRERNYGALTGLDRETVKNQFPHEYDSLNKGYYVLIPKGESVHEVSKRVFPFLRDVLYFIQKNDCDVAISAHENSMKLIEEYLGGLTVRETMRLVNDPLEYKKYLVSFE